MFKQNLDIEFNFEVEENELIDFKETDKNYFNTIDGQVTVVNKNDLLLVITKDIEE